MSNSSCFLAYAFIVLVASLIGSTTETTISGKSVCSAHDFKVSITTNNTKLLLDPPTNQTIVTQTLVELLQSGSDLFSKANGGPNTIEDVYTIYGQLCLSPEPHLAKSTETVQFLSHGDTLDHTYWDIAPGYSYIDAAVAAGYATFSYDRIGVGKSQHPDPLQTVQAPLHVEIAHRLVTMIRNAEIGPGCFKRVVGVGHSAGSTVTQGVTTKYPKDFDAVILTGTSTSAAFVNTAIASFDLTIANLDASGKFAGLQNGYLVQPNQQAIQFPFFRWPNFDPEILAVEVTNKQTQTFGELLTLPSIFVPSAEFQGAVDVVLGENDLVSCGGDCTKPTDQSALMAPFFYPAASRSEHFIVPGAGHSIFAHYSAEKAFAHMIEFLRGNGI
ncbi:MAG: hypothetical protein Q9210_006314 [Variospora velana]